MSSAAVEKSLPPPPASEPAYPGVHSASPSSSSSSSVDSSRSQNANRDSDEATTPTSENPPALTCERGRNGILIRNQSRSASLPPNRFSTSSDFCPSTGASSTSSILSMSVKFAPLPQIPTSRRRKSSTPLGVAARGQMMKKRRHLQMQQQQQQQIASNHDTSIHHAEIESQLRSQQAPNIGSKGVHIVDEMEDPFVHFGKKLKGALFKHLKHKGKDRESATVTERDGSVVTVIGGEKRVVLATIEPNSDEGALEELGGVWEEEVGDTFRREIGQTDTLREGDGWSPPTVTINNE